ncbi:MAG: hypothetical protein F6K11_27035 [Leptolyngbya sp. SIO3F4]|nr:hypothetical protein [Leptolyngbya sp. SIO3F4]
MFDTGSLTPKEKVLALLNSFNIRDQGPIAYINPNKYIQHNLAVADGLAGFVNNNGKFGFGSNVMKASDG